MNSPDIKDIYELAPMQEGILFHYLLDADSEAYVEQVSLTLEGELVPELFEKSLNLIIERHDALRTVFICKEADRPLQVVLGERKTNIYYQDASAEPGDRRESTVQDYLKNDRKKGFDLEKEVLIRLALIKLEDGKHQMILSYHHIIMDGWCLSILGKELFGFYLSLAGESPLKLDPVFPYGDYIKWLEEQSKEEAVSYWKNYLDDYEQQAVIPENGTARINRGFDYKKIDFKLDRELTAGLERLAVDHHVTLSTVVHTIWGVLLQKYNHADDVVFGSVVSGRPPEVPGIENMIGLFINTVPLRMKSAAGKTFGMLVQEVHDSMLEANNYNYLSLVDIQGETALKNNLINHILVFENYPMDGDTIDAKYGLKIAGTEMIQHSNYNFDITVFPQLELEFLITYNGFLYDEAFINSMKGHISEIVKNILLSPAADLQKISILTEEEQNRILFDFNRTETTYPWDKTVHQRFESLAENNPQRTALIYNGQRITYEELNAGSNRLARFFIKRGVRKGDFVNVLMERSPLMAACILGIWKAGAAYIPMDVKHPDDRKVSVIEDSRPRLILSQSLSENSRLCGNYPGQFVNIGEHEEEIGKESADNLHIDVHIQDVAYALFTSGSTGRPKGVLIEHLGMLNHIFAERDFLGLTDRLVFAQNANHCFDISVWQFFCALAMGGTTVIYPDDLVLKPEDFLDRIIQDGVTLLEVVPSYLTVLMDLIEQKSIRMPDLKHLFITGEPASPSLVKRWFGLCPEIKMVNAYGPAEASDDISQWMLDSAPAEMETVPIGKPLANIRIYIVDPHMHLCPVGVQGEICVAGISVGRGYLNNPEKTQESFMDSPFANEQGVRFYKTGDLGKWLPDGSIDFCGRKDYQVKIRGFRIELNEIENRLTGHGQVKEAVVIAWDEDNGSKFLCAYFTSDEDLAAQELKRFLGQFVPEYMIPAYFVRLEELPLNSNGKVDRKKLEKPERNLQTSFTAPNNETEQALAAIWQEVLGREQVGIDHDFFEMGGHSLKATVIVSRIYGDLDVDIGVKDVFAYPTIAELAQYVDTRAKSGCRPIASAQEKEYYMLSAAQKRMYILNELEDNRSIAYNMPAAYQICGNFNVTRFEQMIQALINRHEILRTSFTTVKGEPVQVIHKAIRFEVGYREIESWDAKGLDEGIASFIRPFDLGKAPLFRAEVLKTADGGYLLLFDMHHIISDGISGKILLEELLRLYEGQELPEPVIHYKDFAVWQNEMLQSDGMNLQEQYWVRQFGGEIPVLDLPLDYRRPAMQSFEGKTLHFTAGAELTERIHRLAARARTTLFPVLLAAFQILLAKYSGQQDIVVGSPMSGRNRQELQSMLGMFVNTVALRNYPDSGKTFGKFLDEVAETTYAAIENQDYQFERLIDRLNLPRDTSRNPLFDVMFSLFDQEEAEICLGDAIIAPYAFENTAAKFDLMLDAYPDAENLSFDLQYCTALFKDETAFRIAEHYLNILNEACADPDIKLSRIHMLSPAEVAKILEEFNDTYAEFEFGKAVHELFEEHAAKTPLKTALLYKGEGVAYKDLNGSANRIARYLRKIGMGKEDVVAVLLERSPAFAESVLGIWKSQGAYVPMDTAHGVQRKIGALKDSGAKVLITMSSHLEPEVENHFGGHILCLDRLSGELLKEDTENLKLASDIRGLSYILFTSGSTGKPKGVMIEHLGMLNHILAEAKALQLGSDLVFAQNANQMFDISVWQFFGALALGGTTAIYPNELVLEVGAFTERLIRDKVTLLEVVPTYLDTLMDHMESGRVKPADLKYLMITGETVKPAAAERWFQLCPGTSMVNAYGPAEAADDVSQYVMKQPPDGIHTVPIGKPIANMNLYILNADMQLCPVGVFGEICAAGVGVGRGYVNDPEKTGMAFREDPFSPVSGTRLYKTGDMGRWLPDGNIEFAGRKDFQVKIKGFRIELEEIEAVILLDAGVKETVAAAKEDRAGGKYLCAYLVVRDPFDLHELKNRIQDALPEYMMPAYFVVLEQLPLLENGKINRKALPEPDRLADGGTKYRAPQNEIEEMLAQIWGEVLGLHPIGTEHNFFENGGDSIKAIQISSKLSAKGYTMKVKDLFQNPQISKLARCIKRGRREINQGAAEGQAELTPIQKWFFENRFAEMHHWNQAVVLYSRQGFQLEALQTTFAKIIEHHDALRMTYRMEQGLVLPYNRGLDGTGFDLTVKEFRGGKDDSSRIEEAINQLQSSIDLENGPLVKLGLFRTDQGDHLAMVIHHLVIDGVSWRILFEDLNKGYSQALSGEPIQLPEKTDSYLYWASRLNEFADSKPLMTEKEYWNRIESADIRPLPKHSTSLGKKVKDNSQIKFSLTQEETEHLLTRVHKAYNTEINDILLMGLGMAVKNWTGHNQVLVCLEGHGREEILQDVNISRTVGWFTSMFPVILDMERANDLPYQLKQIKETLRQIPNKGIGHGVLRYLTSASKRNGIDFKLEPEIKFNYLGQFDSDISTEAFQSSFISQGRTVSPESEREIALNIGGIIENGILTLFIDYNLQEFNEATVAAFGELFQKSLSQIIAHCTEKETKEVTPSDVGAEDLSIDELEAILSFYEN